MPSFSEMNALVTRSRRPRVALFALLGGIPVALAVYGEITNAGDLTAVASLLLLLEALGFFMWPALAPPRPERQGDLGLVQADEAGLRFEGDLLLAPRDVQNVVVEPLASGACRVWLGAARTRDDVTVTVASEERAELLVSVLGLDRLCVSRFLVARLPPRTRRGRLTRTVRAGAGVAVILAVSVALAQREPAEGLLVVPLLVAYVFLLAALGTRRATELVLGADGLAVGRGRERLVVPIADVLAVLARREGTALVRIAGGEEIELRFGEDERGTLARNAFVAGAHEAIAARKRDPAVSPVAGLLVRAATSDTRAWLDAVRGVGAEGEDYRRAHVPDEALWRVVESSSVDPSARVGALLALRARGSARQDGGVTSSRLAARFRDMAEQIVHEKVRAAFEAAAAGAEDEVVVTAFDRGSS